MPYEVSTEAQHTTSETFSEACGILIAGLTAYDPSGVSKPLYYVEGSEELDVKQAVELIASKMYAGQIDSFEFEAEGRNFWIGKL